MLKLQKKLKLIRIFSSFYFRVSKVTGTENFTRKYEVSGLLISTVIRIVGTRHLTYAGIKRRKITKLRFFIIF